MSIYYVPLRHRKFVYIVQIQVWHSVNEASGLILNEMKNGDEGE